MAFATAVWRRRGCAHCAAPACSQPAESRVVWGFGRGKRSVYGAPSSLKRRSLATPNNNLKKKKSETVQWHSSRDDAERKRPVLADERRASKQSPSPVSKVRWTAGASPAKVYAIWESSLRRIVLESEAAEIHTGRGGGRHGRKLGLARNGQQRLTGLSILSAGECNGFGNHLGRRVPTG